MNTPATLLSVRNLTMRFGGLTAIDDLSLEVPAGPPKMALPTTPPATAPTPVPTWALVGLEAQPPSARAAVHDAARTR